MVQESAARQSQEVVVVQYSSLVSCAEDEQDTRENHSVLEQQIEQVYLCARCVSNIHAQRPILSSRCRRMGLMGWVY